MADQMAPLPMTVLRAGASVLFEAIDATTGAAVAGVQISSATIYAVSRDDDELDTGPLLPVYLIDQDD